MNIDAFSKFSKKPSLRNSNITLRGFDGNITNSLGESIIDIGIGYVNYLVPVQIVDNLQVDLILGTPFLNTFGVVLDFNTGFVIIEGDSMIHSRKWDRREMFPGETINYIRPINEPLQH